MALEASFELPPKKAIEFFRKKGYVTSFAWQDVDRAEHQAAFTVAKLMDIGLLSDVRAAVDKAIAEGATFADFRDQIEGRLVQAGWWGKAEMVDPLDGETKTVQLGSPRRLRTIFENNLRSAYAEGQWKQVQDTAIEAPYLMYDAVDDGKTRPEHKAWDGIVLPATDPWWSTHYPPNDYGCRCGVIQLSADEVRAMGKSVAEKAPPSPTYTWTNPRTGEVKEIPVGVGPGWAAPPGKGRAEALREQLEARMKEWRNGR